MIGRQYAGPVFMAKSKKKKIHYLTRKQIMQKYSLSKKLIHDCFPAPEVITFRGRSGERWTSTVWSTTVVEEAIQHPQIQKEFQAHANKVERERQIREIMGHFAAYSPESYIERARQLHRTFILHVGPTNSGKTYDAIEDLKKYTPGAYLGPLRLLALEMFDKINDAGIPCSMLTGEESIETENAQIISSTIELCNFNAVYKTAVIDEAQLIADKERGSAWLKAICLVNADVVHICMAPEALSFIERLITSFGDEYRIVRHQRLAPLQYAGRCKGYRDFHPDDAIICFSRKNVLSTAAILEKHGFHASVIYGALPPEARRNEVRKYLSGESNIVVATDAIGLGISLPIKRIIFAETQKFDGKEFRPLTTAEIKQIGGRAGRYGLHEYGEVLVLGSDQLIAENLGKDVSDVKQACIGFPREVLSTDYPLELLLLAWDKMPKEKEFMRESMKDARILLQSLKNKITPENRELVYDLITCPVDTRSEELIIYWAKCASAILKNKSIPEPYFGDETLQECELQYKAYDIHHQLLRRIGIEDDCSAQRCAICDKIAALMRESKELYIRRCRVCGKELPIGSVFNYCNRCYFQQGAGLHGNEAIR